MENKISILICSYNAEKYVEQCLFSISKNKLNNCELIILDDASTDNTYNIIEKTINNSPSLKAITKLERNTINQGIGISRARLINESSGNYFIFIDSDDWIERNYIDEFFNLTEDDADIITCDYFVNSKKKSTIIKQSFSESMEENFKKLLNSQLKPFLWCKMVKKSLLNNVDLSPLATIKMSEDRFIISQALLNARTFKSIGKPLYHYRVNNSSITNTPSIEKNKATFQVFDLIKKELEKNNLYEFYKFDFERKKLLLKKDFIYTFNPSIKIMKYIFTDNDYILIKIYKKTFNVKHKVFFFFISKHLFLIIKLITSIKHKSIKSNINFNKSNTEELLFLKN